MTEKRKARATKLYPPLDVDYAEIERRMLEVGRVCVTRSGRFSCSRPNRCDVPGVVRP